MKSFYAWDHWHPIPGPRGLQGVQLGKEDVKWQPKDRKQARNQKRWGEEA